MLEKTFAELVLHVTGRRFQGKVASNNQREEDGSREQPVPDFFFDEKANTLPAPTSHVVIQRGAEQHKQLNQYWRSAAALGTNA